MAYDTTEAVAKFLSGFQMKITNRERDTVAPDYYVKYSLTLSKGGKDFSTTFMPFSRGFPTTRSGWNKPSSTAFSKAARAISTRWFRWHSTSTSSPTSTTIARISAVTAPSTS